VKPLEPTLINIHHGFNFRDLGGYPGAGLKTIKQHKLIRSGKLDLLSDRDVQFLDDYGVRYDVDFRSPEELQQAPDRKPSDASYYHLPVFPVDETKVTKYINREEEDKIFSEHADGGYKNMLKTYADMVLLPSAQKAYRGFFDLLLGNDGDNEALLFHCSAGKDRTGMGAVYLLSALGVNKKLIRSDYIATTQYIQQPLEDVLVQIKKRHMGTNYEQSIRDLWTVKLDYLESAMATIDEHYGSMQHYLHSALDLTDQQVADLRQIYLA
jgi:protein-tyrosine phosphatase